MLLKQWRRLRQRKEKQIGGGWGAEVFRCRWIFKCSSVHLFFLISGIVSACCIKAMNDILTKSNKWETNIKTTKTTNSLYFIPFPQFINQLFSFFCFTHLPNSNSANQHTNQVDYYKYLQESYFKEFKIKFYK